MHRKPHLYAEFFTLFILLPGLIWQLDARKYFFLILWGFALCCHWFLRKDKDFDQKNLLRKEAVTRKNLRDIVLVFIAGTIILGVYTYFVEPQRFLSLIRQNPYFWALIMVLYPLLSVYPQEIIYRAFIFERYKAIFTPRVLLLVSSVCFSWAHIIFDDFIAVFLSVIGGLIFGRNYQKNRSLLLVAIEHGLYGCMIFTVGLGWYFYHGTVRVN